MWTWRYTMGTGANKETTYTQVTCEGSGFWVLGGGYGWREPFPAGQAMYLHVPLIGGGQSRDHAQENEHG
jgi:hypothetical protein